MSLVVWLPLTKDLRQQGLLNSTATATGTTTFAAGKLGQALNCNGSSFWTIPNVTLGSSASIACWCKTTVSDKMLWVLESDANNKLNFYWSSIYTLNTGDSNKNPFRTDSGANINILNDGEWHHFVITFDGSASKLYIDGTYAGKAKTFRDPTSTNQKIKLAGGYNNGHSYDWNGMINDFRVYNHCLSPMEVKELAKGLVLHYPLNRNGWGQENILLGVPKSTSATSYCFKKLNMVSNLEAEKTYTMQLWDVNVSHSAKTEAQTGVWVYWGGGSVHLFNWAGSTYFTNGHADYLVKTFTVTSSQASGSGATNSFLHFYNSVPSVSGTLNATIGRWKLEEGSIATPWCPNSTDELAITMGLNSTTEYDCSGFCNDGTRIGSLGWTSDTPKYQVSTEFNGTNATIDCGNAWHSQGSLELTFSAWVYVDDWGSGNTNYYLSSQQTGGIILQSLATSNNIRARIHAYTAADLSTYSYYQADCTYADTGISGSGWHMLTGVYTTSSIKLYIDGILKKTTSLTTYGIHFNNTAHMFLAAESAGTTYSNLCNCKISDVRIYATALSANDVKSLYQNCATIDPDGTIRGQIRS